MVITSASVFLKKITSASASSNRRSIITIRLDK